MAKRILVVDDEKELCESIRLALASEGYEVCAVSNGMAALDELKSSSPDLIILDLMMPGMNGLKVCKKVRENPLNEKLPILMLTCVDNKETQLKGYELGINEYMIKPFSVWELIARVKILLDPRRADDTKK